MQFDDDCNGQRPETPVIPCQEIQGDSTTMQRRRMGPAAPMVRRSAIHVSGNWRHPFPFCFPGLCETCRQESFGGTNRDLAGAGGLAQRDMIRYFCFIVVYQHNKVLSSYFGLILLRGVVARGIRPDKRDSGRRPGPVTISRNPQATTRPVICVAAAPCVTLNSAASVRLIKFVVAASCVDLSRLIGTLQSPQTGAGKRILSQACPARSASLAPAAPLSRRPCLPVFAPQRRDRRWHRAGQGGAQQ